MSTPDQAPRLDWNIPRDRGSRLSVPVVRNGVRIGSTELASGSWRARCDAYDVEDGRFLAAWSTSPTGSEGSIVFTGEFITVCVTIAQCRNAAWSHAHFSLMVQGPEPTDTMYLLAGTMALT